MQDQDKVSKIRELCYEIIGRNIAFVEGGYGTYYDYDRVIGLLDQASIELDLARTPRPANLPEDIAWCETLWNGEEGEPDPFIFNGSMSVADFEKFQNRYFDKKRNYEEKENQI